MSSLSSLVCAIFHKQEDKVNLGTFHLRDDRNELWGSLV